MMYSNDSNKKLTFIIATSILGVALLSFAIWFFVIKKSSISIMSPFGGNKSVKVGKGDTDLSNKVMSPLTGEYFNKDATWAGTRPLGVMVNNFTDARPQSGLLSADVVYEIVAEGGITRFLAFFLTDTPSKIGPVRSTREYYLVLIKELGDAMLMHIGYSPQALVAIEQWPVRSLGRADATFWRDQDRLNSGIATEHTAYVDGKYLREYADTLGWSGNREIKPWQFKNDKEDYANAPKTSEVSIDFWAKGDYSTVFKYKEDTNTYVKFTGYDAQNNPMPHLDQETKKQIEVKNLIVQFVTEVSISGDEKNRLDYQLVGSGEGLVFIDGRVIKITWSKASRDERTLFYDTDGKELKFNRGKFWISIVPDRNVGQVIYSSNGGVTNSTAQ